MLACFCSALVWSARQECVGSATEGFLVGELEERGKLGIRFSGKDRTTGVNGIIHSSY